MALPSGFFTAPPSQRASMAISSSTSLPLDSRPRPGDPEKHLQEWSSFIGIAIVIVGNILIALAMNVQRYAHLRIHRKRVQARRRATRAFATEAHGADYGSTTTIETGSGSPKRTTARQIDDDHANAHNSHQSSPFRDPDYPNDTVNPPPTYLRDPYWWLGQILITVGEMGNFLAYGFAPASIVSPLGVVGLISNCILAPIVFKEAFRVRDFLGVIIAVGGAVTVVLSANQEETKLEPHDVWDAITTLAFEIYLAVTCALIILLMWLSPRYASKTILIDLGLVGLFGGYTALATKGVSSMLSSALFKAFTTPVTYALLFVLLGTAAMQVRYVNKALQRFDSTQVIPTQFVLFTLSVIIGSAVLYRDFEKTTVERALKFVIGCLLTFFGVFLITSGRPRQDDHDEYDHGLDAGGADETIGLADQHALQTPWTPAEPSSGFRSRTGSIRTRRSSRSSRASFMNRPLSEILADPGIPSRRTPVGASSKSLPVGAGEDSPLLENPWRDSPQSQRHPRVVTNHALSSDPAKDFSPHQPTLTPHSLPSLPPSPERQLPFLETCPGTLSTESSTLRHLTIPTRLRPYPQPVLSSSPFSLTVTGLVADHLRSHAGAALTIRSPPSSRATNTGILNFRHVPRDDDQHPDAPDDRSRPPIDHSSSWSGQTHVEAEENRTAQTTPTRSPGRRGGFQGLMKSLGRSLGGFFGSRVRGRRQRHLDGEGGRRVSVAR